MSVSFPDGRQPRDSIAEIGFSPQPPDSARPGEIFEQVGFWFYPYANRHSLNTPRVDLDALILDPGELFQFHFEWIILKASGSNYSAVRPHPNLNHKRHVDRDMAREYIARFKIIWFIIPLDHVPDCGVYKIQVTIRIIKEGVDPRPLKQGESNVVRVSTSTDGSSTRARTVVSL